MTMKKDTVIRYIGAGLFCLVAFAGLLNVFTGKVEFSYFRFGNYGNVFVPMFSILIPVLLALTLVFELPTLGLVAGVLGVVFYALRLFICLPAFLKNVQMTYMSYGIATIDIMVSLLLFVLVSFIFLLKSFPSNKKRSMFGLGLTAAILRLVSLIVSIAFSFVMSLQSYKTISNFTFFYPQIKLTGAKCYHVMITGNSFLIQDILFVLGFFFMAFALKKKKK